MRFSFLQLFACASLAHGQFGKCRWDFLAVKGGGDTVMFSELLLWDSEGQPIFDIPDSAFTASDTVPFHSANANMLNAHILRTDASRSPNFHSLAATSGNYRGWWQGSSSGTIADDPVTVTVSHAGMSKVRAYSIRWPYGPSTGLSAAPNTKAPIHWKVYCVVEGGSEWSLQDTVSFSAAASDADLQQKKTHGGWFIPSALGSHLDKIHSHMLDHRFHLLQNTVDNLASKYPAYPTLDGPMEDEAFSACEFWFYENNDGSTAGQRFHSMNLGIKKIRFVDAGGDEIDLTSASILGDANWKWFFGSDASNVRLDEADFPAGYDQAFNNAGKAMPVRLRVDFASAETAVAGYNIMGEETGTWYQRDPRSWYLQCKTSNGRWKPVSRKERKDITYPICKDQVTGYAADCASSSDADATMTTCLCPALSGSYCTHGGSYCAHPDHPDAWYSTSNYAIQTFDVYDGIRGYHGPCADLWRPSSWLFLAGCAPALGMHAVKAIHG